MKFGAAVCVALCSLMCACGGGGGGGGSSPAPSASPPAGAGSASAPSGSSTPSASPPVSSPSPPETVFSVAAAGDIAQCNGLPPSQSGAAQTEPLVKADDLFVLTLGDSTYPDGTLTEFTDCFQPAWGALKDRIKPAPGNHDYNTPGAAGYFGYFGSLAGPDQRGYYSFDYAGWHFMSMNSNVDASPGSAQYSWLAQDLAASASALCRIAYWHHPVFSSGPHGNNPQMVAVFGLLQSSGADIVLSGHDHLYERFAPQDANGAPDPTAGIREFVVGTGGADLYAAGPAKPNSEVRIDTTHGILRLTLGSGHYSWAFQPSGGGTALDTGTGTCRGQPH